MEALRPATDSPARPIPVVRGSSIEWRSSTTGHLVGLTGVAPRGRKGLWAAMAAASGAVEAGATVEVEVEAEPEMAPVVPLAPEAHIAYLARLAFSRAGESIKARTPETRVVAEVVDIDVFRARHRTCRH